ncbi:hypothetical protein LXL04_012868 [Taraxacum kok-saghyz]
MSSYYSSISCNQPSIFSSTLTMLPDPMFKTLKPKQVVICTHPNPVNHRCHLHTPRIRVRVLDSPVAFTGPGLPKIAAMIVPVHRETDWNFCTNAGHLQLLYDYSNLSRLILISNDLPPDQQHPSMYILPPVTDTVDSKKLEDALQPLVMSLHPIVSFKNGLPKPRFLKYEDDLLYREIKATFVGPFVGEFVVEDVLLECYDDSVDKKLRRNLRFKRMPNLIQSQVHLYPVNENGKTVTAVVNLENLQKWKNVRFEIDTELLVHSYLTPMVTGLLLISPHLNDRIQQRITPRALCLGVGGGALLTFLNTKLGFEVVGVEADQAVLTAATQHFGFNKSGSIQVIVGDAIDVIQNFPFQQTKKNADDSDSDPNVKVEGVDCKFDVVMVDLDSSYGYGAPPQDFVKKSVFEAVRLLLHDHGVVIINVVPLNDQKYKTFVEKLKGVFHKVYEIDVEEESNCVLMATLSPSTYSYGYNNAFVEKLRRAIVEDYMESIEEL